MKSTKCLEEQRQSVQAEIKQLENRQKILLNRNHSLGNKGAFIHPLGAVRSAEGIL